jgi:RNA polymerase sigma factor (sigma-70 family)
MAEMLVTPVRRVEERVKPAFEELYRSSRDDVYAYVATLLGDRLAAEDITATAFERAYRKRRSFNARRGSPRAWLFGIARNAALDELRRRSRTARLMKDVADETDEIFPSDTDELGRRLALRSALDSLTPRERDLIALKFHAGLGNQELARVLATSETNVGTLLHRTIQKLRKACHETP